MSSSRMDEFAATFSSDPLTLGSSRSLFVGRGYMPPKVSIAQHAPDSFGMRGDDAIARDGAPVDEAHDPNYPQCGEMRRGSDPQQHLDERITGLIEKSLPVNDERSAGVSSRRAERAVMHEGRTADEIGQPREHYRRGVVGVDDNDRGYPRRAKRLHEVVARVDAARVEEVGHLPFREHAFPDPAEAFVGERRRGHGHDVISRRCRSSHGVAVAASSRGHDSFIACEHPCRERAVGAPGQRLASPAVPCSFQSGVLR
jgi:hypothetical protein